MSNELGRDLVARDAITPEAFADALFHATTRGVPLTRALIDVGAIDEARMQEELDRLAGDVPLEHIDPAEDLASSLPPGLIERIYCVPIGYDLHADCVHVAVVDPTDEDGAAEIGFHLGVQARAVRASLGAVEGALARLRGRHLTASSRRKQHTLEPAPSYGFRTLFPEAAAEERNADDDEDAKPLPLSRPARSKSPAALEAVPFPDVGAVYATLREANDRDQVVGLLLAGARTVAQRVGIFLVKRESVEGFRASSKLVSPAAFRQVRLPLNDGNLLAEVACGDMFVGPVADTIENMPLRFGLTLTDGDVAAVAVRIGGIAALVLLADELVDAELARTRLEDFALAAGESLTRIVRAARSSAARVRTHT